MTAGRPTGRTKSNIMINIDINVKHKIQLKRKEDPSFNLSETVNNLLSEYFKIQGDDIDTELEEIKRRKEEVLSEITALSAKEKLFEDQKKKQDSENKKKRFDKYGGIEAIE